MLWLAVLLATWFAVNLATLERSPAVWRDEVMFAEPAVRFLQGHGFTVTSWPAPAGTPAVFNGPLYSLLLVPWLAAWGIGPVAARSLGLVLAAASAVLLWRLALGLGVVRSGLWRLVGVVVLLCGSGVAWGYRSGRYDPLGVLLLTVLVWTVGRGAQRRCVSASVGSASVGSASDCGPPTTDYGLPTTDHGLPTFGWHRAVSFLMAAAIPFAGLYLIPYMVLLGLGVVAVRGRSFAPRLVLPALGLGAGLGFLGALHWHLGTWAATAGFIASQRAPLSERMGSLLSGLWADPSLLPLLGALVCLLPACRRIRPLRWPVLLGLAAGVVIPGWMTLAGRYPPYYAWMAFVPVLAAVLRAVESRVSGPESPRRPSTSLRVPESAPPTRPGPAVPGGAAGGAPPLPEAFCLPWLVVTALALSAAVGLPLRLAASVLEWRQRDYAPVQRLVASCLRPEDVVLTSWEAYYAVTCRCRETLLPAGGLWPTGKPPERVTALVAGSDLVEEGGPPDEQVWTRVASYHSPTYSLPVRLGDTRWYEVSVWRRR